MSRPRRRFRWTPESLTGKIIVGAGIALLAGGSAPWWWPKKSPKILPPECSQDNLRGELVRAGADKATVIKTTARIMREKFRRQEFDCVSNLVGVFLENDQDNGHGLYFAGEVWRVRAS